MQNTVLNKIVKDKAEWIVTRKEQQPLSSFKDEVKPSSRDFYRALRSQRGKAPALILECKKASPSKGLIRQDFDPAIIAEVYSHYASAISVLTDEKYFQGSFDFLPLASGSAHQPILCKDFMIDPYQVWLARYYQADAILLMLSVVSDQQYRELADLAHQLGMGVLTEVISEAELQRASALGAKVIGINNRDLRDLTIDLNRTRQLAPLISQDVTIISESGIDQYRHIQQLSQFADGFLIGSSLMQEDNLDAAIRRLILGENKVCGLTRAEDAAAAYQAGAVYGGLIFAAGSPRLVDIEQARQVQQGAPQLKYVGVFRDAPSEVVINTCQTLSLAAVQLHGHENADYIIQLRDKLPDHIQIWKALSITDHLPERNWLSVDRYIFDHGSGGSGQCFDWGLLKDKTLDNVMLAGGLNADNCMQAAGKGCAGLDFNSGVESAPGIKDRARINAVFQILRAC